MEFVKNEVKDELDGRTNTFLVKQDKVELIEKMNDIKVELNEKINSVKTELIDRNNKSKTETIVWIVGVGVLQFIFTNAFQILF